MANQVIILVCLASVCGAVFVDPYGKVLTANKRLAETLPRQQQPMWHKYSEYAYPKYEFEYAVSDPHSGDYKRHRESRDGDNVRGEYSLLEPGGSLRRVQYTADDHTGFNVVVSKAVHKHGDNAFSFTGYARHFLPIGGGQKYTEFFPNTVSHETHEAQKQSHTFRYTMPSPVKIPNRMMIDDADKFIPAVVTDLTSTSSPASVSNTKSEENIATKTETASVDAANEVVSSVSNQKPNPIEMNVQEIMALIMKNQVKPQPLTEAKAPIIENTLTIVPSDDTKPALEVKVPAEVELKPEASDSKNSVSVADSAAASSYYRTQVYYLGY